MAIFAIFGLLILGFGFVMFFGTKSNPETESEASLGRKKIGKVLMYSGAIVVLFPWIYLFVVLPIICSF